MLEYVLLSKSIFLPEGILVLGPQATFVANCHPWSEKHVRNSLDTNLYLSWHPAKIIVVSLEN